MSDSASAMPNGFDILKKMWEAFSPPTTFTSPLTQLMQSAAPLLDPHEIENRIAEMRAVEQWLTLNLNVLRSTIQAFEVQRATYATLRSFSGGFDPEKAAAAASAFSPASAAADMGNAWRSMFTPADEEPVEDVTEKPAAEVAEPEPAAAATDSDAGAGEGAGSPFADAASAYGALDPSLWFNAMRAQFDQIAAAAQAAGVSATQMTEAAAAQMSEAAAKATEAASTVAAGMGGMGAASAGSRSRASAGAAGKSAPRKPAAKTAGKSAAGKTAASKKTAGKTAGTTAAKSTRAGAKAAPRKTGGAKA